MGCNLLSRSVTLVGGEERVLFSPQFPPEKRYRLSVSETSGLGRALITVEMLHAQNAQKIQFSVSPNGGSAIELSGPAIISALAQGGPPTLACDITQSMPEIDLVNFTEAGQDLPVAYGDIGSNGGFPQPFYNYAALYLNAVADIRLLNLAGGVAWEFLGVTPDNLLLNQFRIGSDFRLQGRRAPGPVAATVVWYNRR